MVIGLYVNTRGQSTARSSRHRHPVFRGFNNEGLSFMLNGLKIAPARVGWIGPLSLSLILKTFLAFQDTVVNSDGVVYLEAARMIAEGHFSQSLVLYPMPAYPLLIAVVHMVVPDWMLAAKLLSLFAAAAVTIPIYWLTAFLFDRRAAFYAAMAVALLPSLNDIAPDVIRDPWFLLLSCGSVYWMVKACASERIGGVLSAFVIAGAALLFRIEAISLFLVYFLYLAGLTLFAKAQRRFARKALLFLMVPALIGMVGLVGVGATAEGTDRIDQLRAFARSLLSGRFLARYHDVYTQLKESEKLSPGTSGELFKLARHYMPLLYVIGMLEAFFGALFWPYAAPLWGARRSLFVKGMPLLILMILFHSLLVLLYFLHIDYLSSRYLLFCALLAMPMVGLGVAVLADTCKRVRWRKTCLAVMVFVFLVFPLYRSIHRGVGEDKAIAMAGKWLSGEPELRAVGWAINDLRYYLYAGKPFDYLKEKDEALAIGRLSVRKDYGALEDMARQSGKDVIILRDSKRDSVRGSGFNVFRIVKQIESPQSIITIYANSRLLKNASGQSEGSSD
jgi:4-amino-4-deoxy-L-arabinose transferase-like glycosyltransferase